ncbi:NAD-dependent epimerase/dehydratase family protein [Cochlodiniinecator piscidefendens]|uniref:NAD-dependent epimerase/dehydratase family protein n=1 Tax=Cochlodiniinecator piscidefendens TaxID=2715756 RepID=UPI00140DC8B5|nr:NAD(P)-dependent oxidoreductase [Cochlodiniinecator piscidefendens]
MKKILITGASGFIGKYTVKMARKRGHDVIAVVRNPESIPPEWADDQKIAPLVADLANGPAPFPKVDAVIHVAASLSSNPARQQRDTHSATKGLIEAIQGQPILVLVSSIAVYPANALHIDESCPVEPTPTLRDTYCQSKIAQEALVQRLYSGPIHIMRPGAVFGPSRLWNSHIGVGLGPILVRLSKHGTVPTCYVEHCAQALVIAAEQSGLQNDITNVIDDDRPTRADFLHTMQTTNWPRIIIPFSWKLLLALAHILPQSLPLPGILRPATLRARYQSVTYDTQKLHAMGWKQTHSFEKAFAESGGSDDRS